jgi:hypothetical protein
VTLTGLLVDLDSFDLINQHVSYSLYDSRIFNITTDIRSYNQRLHFILERNDDLIAHDISIRHLSSDGNEKEDLESFHRALQFARGSVRMGRTPQTSEEVGWARLELIWDVANPSFRGTFTIMKDQYTVEPKITNNGSTMMISSKRPAHSLDNRCKTSPEYLSHKRQSSNQWDNSNLIANIGSTNGCPSTRRIAYIGIVTDCTFTTSFDSTDSTHRYILNMVNTASVVFESSFNISLGIRNLTISDTECPTSGSRINAWNAPCSQGNLNTRLQTFSQWRSSLDDRNAYWTLLSGCSVSVGEIGVSWVGALCNSGGGYNNGGSSANVVARTQTQWQVFA